MSSITTKSDRGVVIVDFHCSELTDQFQAREIGLELTELAENGANKLLLNLENVSFMSSAMVGQLFVLNQKCRAGKVALKICCVPDVIMQVFEIVGLDDFIEIHASVAAGLESFDGGGESETAPQSTAADHRAAAEGGDRDAQYELARCYEEGWGVEADEEQAQRWLAQAAKSGHLDAQYRMGQAYAYGIRVPQDYRQAIQWYEPAAERGHVEARYAMGMSYLYGIGVTENPASARHWYQLAAEQGHVKARAELAKLDD